MKKIMFNDRYGLTQAVLDGRKTMTRRLCSDTELRKLKLSKDFFCMKCTDDEYITKHLSQYQYSLVSRYSHGEVVAVAQSYNDIISLLPADENGVLSGNLAWAAFGMSREPGYNNKMFVRSDLMPHQIKITDIKVERLQDISDEDCLKEGVLRSDRYAMPYGITDDTAPNGVFFFHSSPREAFATLIDKVSGKGTWERNPWVFAYSFELVK